MITKSQIAGARAAIPHAASKNDLDEACLILQDILGVTDGGVAAMCFSGTSDDWFNWSQSLRVAALEDYLRTEIIWNEDDTE